MIVRWKKLPVETQLHILFVLQCLGWVLAGTLLALKSYGWGYADGAHDVWAWFRL